MPKPGNGSCHSPASCISAPGGRGWGDVPHFLLARNEQQGTRIERRQAGGLGGVPPFSSCQERATRNEDRAPTGRGVWGASPHFLLAGNKQQGTRNERRQAGGGGVSPHFLLAGNKQQGTRNERRQAGGGGGGPPIFSLPGTSNRERGSSAGRPGGLGGVPPFSPREGRGGERLQDQLSVSAGGF